MTTTQKDNLGKAGENGSRAGSSHGFTAQVSQVEPLLGPSKKKRMLLGKDESVHFKPIELGCEKANLTKLIVFELN